VNLVLRTLHTVKSAAMVANRDEITRLTHLSESVVVAVRDEKLPWPATPMQNYLGWLHQISANGDDLSAVLAEAALHETELLATLTASAG
jgi:chemotaxis protein histidine kinase CheA